MSKHDGKVTPNTTNVENVIKEGIFNESRQSNAKRLASVPYTFNKILGYLFICTRTFSSHVSQSRCECIVYVLNE